jgi:hypothetical protein
LRRASLRSQLNQIRLWVRQGRTDAWIAHKLDISVEELQRFKRDQRLDGEPPPSFAPLTAGEPPPELEELEDETPDAFEEAEEPEESEADEQEEDEDEDEDEREGGGMARRRRGRRGGRRRRARRTPSFEGTFDHGEEGYGLWLDPAIADSDVYSENWAGHRDVTVTVEPDAITIRRSGTERR